MVFSLSPWPHKADERGTRKFENKRSCSCLVVFRTCYIIFDLSREIVSSSSSKDERTLPFLNIARFTKRIPTFFTSHRLQIALCSPTLTPRVKSENEIGSPWDVCGDELICNVSRELEADPNPVVLRYNVRVTRGFRLFMLNSGFDSLLTHSVNITNTNSKL